MDKHSTSKERCELTADGKYRRLSLARGETRVHFPSMVADSKEEQRLIDGAVSLVRSYRIFRWFDAGALGFQWVLHSCDVLVARLRNLACILREL